MQMDRKTVALCAALACLFAVALLPGLTGVGLHEWLGLGVWVALLVHVARHLPKLWAQCRAARKHGALRAKGRCALSLALFVLLAVCALSGIMESGEVMRSFGLYSSGFYSWQPLHAFAAKALLSLVVVHVALHARMLSGAVSRRFARRSH